MCHDDFDDDYSEENLCVGYPETGCGLIMLMMIIIIKVHSKNNEIIMYNLMRVFSGLNVVHYLH